MTDECKCKSCTDFFPLPVVKAPPIVPAVPAAVLARDEAGPRLPQMVANRRASYDYEKQGTGYDSGACGYELQGRRRAPDPKRTIIAFTGLAGSGKSTAAQHLVDRHGYTRVRFAGPLKAMLTAFYAAAGLDADMIARKIEGDLKETPCDLLGGRTPRYAMQTLGTEWGRDIIHADLWTSAWRAAVDKVPAGKPVVVDDCRFPNEAEALRAAGGVLVRIYREGAGAGAAGHSSEKHKLRAYESISNNGTVDQLLRSVEILASDMTWAMAGTH